MKAFLLIIFLLPHFCLTFSQTNQHFETAIELNSKKKYSQALIEMDKAIDMEPFKASYYVEKSIILFNLENFKEAFKILYEAAIHLPDSTIIYAQLGTYHDMFQLFDEAILDFTNAYEKSESTDDKSTYLSNRGGLKFKIRDYNDAYEDLKLSLEFDSSNIDALNNLAAVLDELDRNEEAFATLEKIIKVDTNYIPGYVNLGFQHQAIGNHEKAISYFNKAIDLAPDEPFGYSNRSFSLLKKNDIKGAMKDINKSLELMPTNAYAYKIRALIYIEKGNIKTACEDLDMAIKMSYTIQYGEEVN